MPLMCGGRGFRLKATHLRVLLSRYSATAIFTSRTLLRRPQGFILALPNPPPLIDHRDLTSIYRVQKPKATQAMQLGVQAFCVGISVPLSVSARTTKLTFPALSRCNSLVDIQSQYGLGKKTLKLRRACQSMPRRREI